MHLRITVYLLLQILKQLEPLDKEMAVEIEEILAQLCEGKEVVLDTPAPSYKNFIRLETFVTNSFSTPRIIDKIAPEPYVK